MAAPFDFTNQRIALRKRELRFMFALSAVFHLSMAALLVTSNFSLSRNDVYQLPGVISVDLVAAPPAATPRPAPPKAAPPKPPPLVKKPIVKKTVLPKEAMLDPEKPKPLAKAKPKPAPELVPDSKPVVQENYADVMAQLRAEAGESAPEPVVTATAKTAAVPRSPAGIAISPEDAAWIRRTKTHVKRYWVVAPGFRTQDFETHVLVNIDRRGDVRGKPKITKPSGNPWYDESVVRAIIKSSPLPAPPEADRWPFVFRPEDSY